VLATVASLCLATPDAAPASQPRPPGPASAALTGMFAVLRTSSPTSLPATPARTLARLSASSRGRQVDVDVAQARQVGPRQAKLYLVPGRHGVCAVHGTRGACSADLEALSKRGLRFWVLHRRDPETGQTPVVVAAPLLSQRERFTRANDPVSCNGAGGAPRPLDDTRALLRSARRRRRCC